MDHITLFPEACWYWPEGKLSLSFLFPIFCPKYFFYKAPNFFTICNLKNKWSIVPVCRTILEWFIQIFVGKINKNTIVWVLCYKYSYIIRKKWSISKIWKFRSSFVTQDNFKMTPEKLLVICELYRNYAYMAQKSIYFSNLSLVFS